MFLLFFLVSFLACIVGSICGIGGGVIIKPVLDATKFLEVNSVSFLSGCTVLSMTAINVFISVYKKETSIEWKIGTPLAIGAAIGGIIGKGIFQYAYVTLPSPDAVGAVQSITLAIITIGTLIYTIRADKTKTLLISNKITIIIIGLVLGIISSFLGIGGGPINIVVLSFFFSMGAKKAAINSLYIIMLSQLTSLVTGVFTNSIPEFEIQYLILMVIGGVTGGIVGSKINNKISEKNVKKLFIIFMVFIILLNIYNYLEFIHIFK